MAYIVQPNVKNKSRSVTVDEGEKNVPWQMCV